MATRALASARIFDLDPLETRTLVASAVGEGACRSLFTYLAELDMPPVEAILDGSASFTPRPDRLDKVFVVLTGAWGVLRREAGCTDLERLRAAQKAKAGKKAAAVELEDAERELVERVTRFIGVLDASHSVGAADIAANFMEKMTKAGVDYRAFPAFEGLGSKIYKHVDAARRG